MRALSSLRSRIFLASALLAVLCIGVAIYLFPIYWMVITSLKLPREIYRLPALWPHVVTLQNYEKLLAAAREEFTQEGTGATLEDVASRAGVGIGTLYRHFPTRQDLLEAVYLDEVQAICDSADKYVDEPPLEALTGWLREFVGFAPS